MLMKRKSFILTLLMALIPFMMWTQDYVGQISSYKIV